MAVVTGTTKDENQGTSCYAWIFEIRGHIINTVQTFNIRKYFGRSLCEGQFLEIYE